MMKRFSALAVLTLPFLLAASAPSQPSGQDRFAFVEAKVTPRLTRALDRQGLTMGAPVYMRIFKRERVLELWMEVEGSYQLFKTYPICAWSGRLGPKEKEGDRQAPEGFYRVTSGQMNPNSSYHLSFNLGYPNQYDRAHGRTGSYLMVHGSCVSVGCYAMTDRGIEEIYTLANAALTNSQAGFDVHIFPFRMTGKAMGRVKGHQWEGFWRELQPAYDAFEASRQVPKVGVQDGHYMIGG